jgi:hypothetical protein
VETALAELMAKGKKEGKRIRKRRKMLITETK